MNPDPEPKDALNEFVSNAADEYREAGRRGERIRVVLRRRGRYPVIAVDDNGRGMDPDRLRLLARSLFESKQARRPADAGGEGHRHSGLPAARRPGSTRSRSSRAVTASWSPPRSPTACG